MVDRNEATVRGFLADKSAEDAVRRLMATPSGYDPEVWKQMSDQLGLQAMAVPEEYEGAGIDTRTVWSGNITRHPMMAGVTHRIPEGGLPVADEVFQRGMTLGMSHGLSDAEVGRIAQAIHDFASRW